MDRQIEPSHVIHLWKDLTQLSTATLTKHKMNPLLNGHRVLANFLGGVHMKREYSSKAWGLLVSSSLRKAIEEALLVDHDRLESTPTQLEQRLAHIVSSLSRELHIPFLRECCLSTPSTRFLRLFQDVVLCTWAFESLSIVLNTIKPDLYDAPSFQHIVHSLITNARKEIDFDSIVNIMFLKSPRNPESAPFFTSIFAAKEVSLINKRRGTYYSLPRNERLFTVGAHGDGRNDMRSVW